MITTKIQVEAYLAEYIRGKYWDASVGAVRFPAGSDIYVTIYDLMQKRPVGVGMDVGNLEFCLPDRRTANEAGGKSPEQYNHISHRGVRLLERRFKTMMWAELHDTMDENKHLRGMQFIDTVYAFRCRYGIESLSEDAMLKNYQRWRDCLRRKAKRGYTLKKRKK